MMFMKFTKCIHNNNHIIHMMEGFHMNIIISQYMMF